MTLIHTNRGKLNSRFVKWVRQRRRGPRGGSPADEVRRWYDVVIDDEGDEHEVEGGVEPEEFGPHPQIIPATQPMTLHLVGADEDGELMCFTHPIVGWLVLKGDYPCPVALGCQVGEEYSGTNWVAAIELPGGGYQEAEYEGASFPTREAFHEAVHDRATKYFKHQAARDAAREARQKEILREAEKAD
jgi:hypothetical protein